MTSRGICTIWPSVTASIPNGSSESNGKVELSRRTDEKEFYRRVRLRTLDELQARLRIWEHEYSHLRPHLVPKDKTSVEWLHELRISVP